MVTQNFRAFYVCGKARQEKSTGPGKISPVRIDLIPASLNVPAPPLMERSKIEFPPLHIKLGIMKQFLNALEKDDDCFRYICIKFPGLSIEKLKAGVFVGPPDFKTNESCRFL